MSEFGTGYAYCLGLFLAHEMRLHDFRSDKSGLLNPSMWLYGAADHLFGLMAPSNLPQEKQAEINAFRDYVISERLGNDLTFDQAQKLNDTAKRLLLEWDMFNGVEAEKGDWQ